MGFFDRFFSGGNKARPAASDAGGPGHAASTGGPGHAAPDAGEPVLTGEQAGTDGSFEDAFFDAQADMVSICPEGIHDYGEVTVGGRALSGADLKAALEDVYICAAFWGTSVTSFNAFARVAGQLFPLNQVVGGGGFDSVFFQVSDIAIKDMATIKNLCSQYDRQLPCEIRGRYHAESGKYFANFSYDEVLPSDEEEAARGIEDGTVKLPGERFDEWMERVRTGDDPLA